MTIYSNVNEYLYDQENINPNKTKLIIIRYSCIFENCSQNVVPVRDIREPSSVQVVGVARPETDLCIGRSLNILILELLF